MHHFRRCRIVYRPRQLRARLQLLVFLAPCFDVLHTFLGILHAYKNVPVGTDHERVSAIVYKLTNPLATLVSLAMISQWALFLFSEGPDSMPRERNVGFSGGTRHPSGGRELRQPIRVRERRLRVRWRVPLGADVNHVRSVCVCSVVTVFAGSVLDFEIDV